MRRARRGVGPEFGWMGRARLCIVASYGARVMDAQRPTLL
jgi:hypothetical protein